MFWCNYRIRKMTFRIFITAVIAGRLGCIQWSTSQIYFLAKCRCELGLLMIVKSILWINFHKKHLVYWFLIVMEIIACKEKIFLHLIECKEYVYILCETSSKRRLIVISLYWCAIGWIPLRKDGKCNWWKHYIAIRFPFNSSSMSAFLCQNFIANSVHMYLAFRSQDDGFFTSGDGMEEIPCMTLLQICTANRFSLFR